MDLPKAPSQDDVHAISGAWNWIVFFFGLVVSGGIIEYMLSSRYVTKKEWKEHRTQCVEHIKTEFELAVMKNNEEMEKRMIDALSREIRRGFEGMDKK